MIPQEEDWPLGQWVETQPGLLVREVSGRKVKSWPHEPDRAIEIVATVPVRPTLLSQAVLLERYARNEDRLFPLDHHQGGKMVWEMMADVPRMGSREAYRKWVENPRGKAA
jgi:hypothetical protein